MPKPPFVDVVTTYIRLVYFFAKRSVADPDLDDVVQDTFLKAMKAYPRLTYNSDGELKSWLLTICRHVITDFYRSHQQTVPLEVTPHELLDETELEKLLEAKIDSAAGAEKIKTALADLSPQDQQIVHLRVTEEMAFKEIAQAIGLKEPAVKMRFYRSIVKLKQALV